MFVVLCRRVRPLKSVGPHVRGEHCREQVRGRLRLQHPAERPQTHGIPKGSVFSGSNNFALFCTTEVMLPSAVSTRSLCDW